MIVAQRIALVTCAALPDLEPDDQSLVLALIGLRCEVVVVVWDDPAVEWEIFDRVVLRSPIDYVERPAEFLRWAATVPRLHNSFDIVSWNVDKRYLRDLAVAAVPSVSTEWLAPGDQLEPGLRNGAFVVKPSVGVGGRGVERFESRSFDLANKHIRDLHDAGNWVLVQPFLDSIEHSGETSLVYVAGRFSHAVRRIGFHQDSSRTAHPYTPTEAELAVGRKVNAYLSDRFGEVTQLRIDLLADDDRPVVNEVEATDPLLYLRDTSDAATLLAKAIIS